MLGKLSLSLVALLFVAQAEAQSLTLGEPGYGGAGCPQGTVSTILSPDQKQLSILFDQYTVEAGGYSGRRIDRKACNLAIPVIIPQGYSVSILQVDYRGFLALPSGGLGRLTSSYFFAGSNGVTLSREFRGARNADYLETHRLLAEATVWSACGAQTNLRINSNMMVQTNSRNDQAMASVDSVDVSSGVIFHLQWRRCY